MQKISVLLVGIGGFGAFYIRELLHGEKADCFHFAGAVDPYAERTEAYRELHEKGIPVFDTLEQFYKDHSAQLAVIASPTYLHAGQAQYCMQQGSDVLCEKPICASLQDAEAMIRTRNSTGRKLAIGFQWSFDEAILKLKQDMMDGLYGKIHRIRTIVFFPRNVDYYHRGTGWAGKRRLDTGEWILDSVASNATAHYLHNMLFLCGDQTAVSAEPVKMEAEVYRANPIEMFDTCALRLYTAGGTELAFYATHAVLEDQVRDPEFILEGEAGKVILAYREGRAFLQGSLKDGRIIDYGMPGEDGFRKLYAMEEAIQRGEPLSCKAETALPHLKCICALAESFPQTPQFPESDICYNEKTRQYTCRGLGEVLNDCWQKGSLPWEEKIPWAQKPHEIIF